ncbi:MAG: NAD(+)/NADH kinase [Bacteroidales bacterium]|nr:NAD(+)/NADH kinase [Bacteroidales bacterium]MBR6174392.1 NAD(+)/NADH kinase [Bacteroidales bacterium]MBR6904162.1 NAD(+)/NADH kinase [Bacteroidales bacterium]
MPTFALYSRATAGPQPILDSVIAFLLENRCGVVLHKNICCESLDFQRFESHFDLQQLGAVDFMVSIGGDGSFIDAANLVGDLGIPLVGINTGRIGFLSAIKKDNFEACIRMLLDKQYTLESRSLLHIEGSEPLSLDTHFVVNDVTVRATDSDSINAVTVSAGGRHVNTYWADGLIVATPTGSTAYSMSCGGPILHPQTDVVVLTPVASHSLNVRPLVIPAGQTLEIAVDGRGGKYSLCVDTQRVILDDSVRLFITKETFNIQTVLFDDADFYATIREKLLWGLDKRND